MRVNIEAAPVIRDFDGDGAAFVRGRNRDRAARRLARLPPLGRRLDAMVGRVAKQVRQRILDQFQHLAIELGVGPGQDEIDILAEFGAEVAHEPRQLLPGRADGLHPRLHHARLKLGRHGRETLQRRLELGQFDAARQLDQLVAGEHQLGDHRHQPFQRVEPDTDGTDLRHGLHAGHRLAAGPMRVRDRS